MSYGGAAEVPPDVGEGAPIVAKISYLLNSAELAVDESTRHMYVFPNAEEAVVRLTVGATSWAVHMKFLWTCDGCAEGLADGISGGGEATESRNLEFAYRASSRTLARACCGVDPS